MSESVYTTTMVDCICALIAEGKSLRTIEKMEGMPSSTSIMRWLANQGEEFDYLRAQYARAREVRADARFERIDCVIDDMRNKVIDAQQARVEIDAIKWQSGREKPKVYGESVTLKGDKDNPLRVSKPQDLTDVDLLAIAAGREAALDG